MKNVYKSSEPQTLLEYKKRFSKQFQRWNDIKSNRNTYDSIRQTLSHDQKGLCAYCEMELNNFNRSVEHFIPCHQSSPQGNNYDLDWNNMLAVCLPPGGLTESNVRQSKLAKDDPCCGKKKDDFIPNQHFLNPLKLTNSRLFRVSLTGEIRPDVNNCSKEGIAVEDAQFTIDKLGLNVPRLKELRARTIQEVIRKREELDSRKGTSIDLEREAAKLFFGNGSGNWPPFFTTIRWILKEGAEQYLQSIDYRG